ncbi:MAG TPA: peptidoglycan DD-metalloendopeptidase family protein [Burkholderiaceae bacterium]|nr:peptidoglycan DD-metalloendopeptidase family protein [Burkholderiaceae bacterium]
MSYSPRFADPLRAFGAVACAFVVACSSPQRSAPVVDRSATPRPMAGASAASKPPAVSPNALPRSTSYVVKRGDTLYSIALDHGQDYRDIAAWNQLTDPNVLNVGQTLRVTPPDATTTATASSNAVANAETGTQSLPVRSVGSVDARPLNSAPPVVAKVDPKPIDATPETKPTPDVKTPSPVTTNESGVVWAWPAGGSVVTPFNEPKNKGIDISARAGEAVMAAADGKVVYAGSGLRGYGNLVIVKHNENFISAYAHNSKIVVPLDARVKRGQKIAEVGATDADRPKLHFEIRRQGQPVDPMKYLPQR